MARISHGPFPHRALMAQLTESCTGRHRLAFVDRKIWEARPLPDAARRPAKEKIMTSNNLFQRFAALHVSGDPLVLFNAWDVGSADAVAKSGAKAIATGSASVAMANGFGDGQQVPIDFALANARRIVEAVDLPVTVDFEGAYSDDPARARAILPGWQRLARLAAISRTRLSAARGFTRSPSRRRGSRRHGKRSGRSSSSIAGPTCSLRLRRKPMTKRCWMRRSPGFAPTQKLAPAAFSCRCWAISTCSAGYAANPRCR